MDRERDPLLPKGPDGSGANALDIIADECEKLSRYNFQAQQDAADIGTAKDSFQLRQRINAYKEDANRIYTHLAKELKTHYMGKEKARREVLMTQAEKAINDWKKWSALIHQKERSTTLPTPPESTRTSAALPELNNNGRVQSQFVVNLQEVDVSQVDNQIIAEHNRDVKALAEDLTVLRDAFKDVQQVVGQQGETVIQIEQHTESADVAVTEGTKELAKAEVYQNKSRRSCICIVLLISAIVIGLGVFLILWFKVFKL